MEYAQSRKLGKPNNLKILGSNKTKVPKQDSQHHLAYNLRVYFDKELLSYNGVEQDFI